MYISVGELYKMENDFWEKSSQNPPKTAFLALLSRLSEQKKNP
jgi:hypothetical protein